VVYISTPAASTARLHGGDMLLAGATIVALATRQPASELLGRQVLSAALVGIKVPVQLSVLPPPADASNVTFVWPFGAAQVPAWSGSNGADVDPGSFGRHCGSVTICNKMLYICVPPPPGSCTTVAPTRRYMCETPWETATCITEAGEWLSNTDLEDYHSIEWAPRGASVAVRKAPGTARTFVFSWFLVFVLFALMTDAIVRSITKLDIATTVSSGFVITQLLTAFTPSVVAAGPPAVAWTVDVLTGAVAAVTIATCLTPSQKTLTEICCIATLSVSYPEHLVGRQPAMLIQLVCAILICALAAGRREPRAIPAVAWAALVLVYPVLAESLINSDTTALGIVSGISVFAIVGISMQ